MASLFWFGGRAYAAWAFTVFLVLIVLLQLLVQYLLNLWNRIFFDALGRRDAAELWTQAFVFAPLAGASIVLAAAGNACGQLRRSCGWAESAGSWYEAKRCLQEIAAARLPYGLRAFS